MTIEGSIHGFLAAIVFGMGFHVGWGLISLLIDLAARAVGRTGPIEGK